MLLLLVFPVDKDEPVMVNPAMLVTIDPIDPGRPGYGNGDPHGLSRVRLIDGREIVSAAHPDELLRAWEDCINHPFDGHVDGETEEVG